MPRYCVVERNAIDGEPCFIVCHFLGSDADFFLHLQHKNILLLLFITVAGVAYK